MRPKRWTGRIARVWSVILASMRDGSIVYVFGSMSTKIGIALWCRIEAAVDQ